MLAAMAGCTALARQPVGVIRSDPDLRATFESAVREAWAIGRARGVALADDFVEKQMAFLDGLPAEMRSSMLNDLVAGNRLEAPWLSGAVARMAQQGGLPAPVSATLYAAREAVSRRHRPTLKGLIDASSPDLDHQCARAARAALRVQVDHAWTRSQSR